MSRRGQTLLVAMADPLDTRALAEAMVATESLAPDAELSEAVADLDKIGGEASTIRFVNQLLLEAVQERATDIHLEPYEQQLPIRYRVDGVLYDIPVPQGLKRTGNPPDEIEDEGVTSAGMSLSRGIR